MDNEIKLLLLELEAYCDVYITDHESNLYIKQFIEEQKGEHYVGTTQSK